MPERSIHDPNQASADLADSLLSLLRTLPQQPCHHARHTLALLQQLGQLLRTPDSAAPALPAGLHPGWQQPLRHKALQAWQIWRQQSRAWLEGLQLAEAERERLALLGRLLGDSLSPHNSPLNPELAQAWSNGPCAPLRQGLQRLRQDLLLDRPLPPLNDEDAFQVGRDLATCPGQVVARTARYELIQYQASSPRVREHPLLIIPPPLNRYYLLDLTPDTSLIRYALEQGIQIFVISWRNPNPSHCDWGLPDYAASCAEALEACRQLSASSKVSLLGICAGGLVTRQLLQLLSSRDELEQLASLSFWVTPQNPQHPSDLTRLAGPVSRQQLRRTVWRQGCLTPRQLCSAFAWLRPGQLVWPQAMQRYLQGQPTRPDPVLFWNQDSTRLPAQLVDDLLGWLESSTENQPAIPAQIPSWHLGAEQDHIVPWRQSFPETPTPNATFILCRGGHIQGLISPPGRPRAGYRQSPVSTTIDRWEQASSAHEGSWWPAWCQWLHDHSGPYQPSPATPGSSQHPALAPAPGRYVHLL